MRVAIGNNKGGVGKTSAVVNLAAAVAEAGRRVLVVDVDPQANAGRRLGVGFDPAHPTVTISEAIQANQAGCAADVIVPCGWAGKYADLIDVAPARFDLENRVSEAATLGAVLRLRTALDGVDDDYDVTLIDCPPSLGHLTQLALAAVDVAVCVAEPEYDAIEGATRFRDFIAQAGPALQNPGLRLAGVIVSRVRSLSAHAFQVEGLAELFGPTLVWEPHVPERAALKDAADTASPLRALGSGTATEMAWIYSRLAENLLSVGAPQ